MVLKRFLNILRRIFFSLLVILLTAYLALQTEFVQNKLIGIVTNKLRNDLKTDVRIQHISISFFNKLNLEKVFIQDQQKDTILYAGQLKLRITDWFFFKDEVALKYLGLEDGVIKLQRSQKQWNYQFLADYFSSGNKEKSTQKGPKLLLEKIDLKNVLFINNDGWRGEKLTAKVKSLLLNADSVNLATGYFGMNEVQLEEPFFSIDNFEGNRPDSILKKDRALAAKNDKGLRFNLGIDFVIKDLKMKNGRFESHTDADKPMKYFDGAHIVLNNLNGHFENFSFLQDTLKGKILLTAKERCGFELKKLATQLCITPQKIELAKLDLQTNKSRLSNYYIMRFDHFNDDFAHYVTKVQMDAKFKNSTVNSDDIAYFAPELSTWKKQVAISGNFKGTVADFTATNMQLKSGNSTNINGNLKMKGLPDIYKTQILFDNGTIKTNYTDLAVVIPAIKKITQPNLMALGNILFRGNFKGTLNKFTTKSMIATELGGIDASLNYATAKNGDPIYIGNFITKRFNLGKFIGEPNMGLIDFTGNINGTSFNIERLNCQFDGKFDLLEFNGYGFREILANSSFQKKYFKGEIKIDDPNVDFTSNVNINLNDSIPHFNILGDLVKCDLQKINLTPKNKYELTGLIDLNFAGNNIDNFLGSAKLLNANLINNGERLDFDSLVLQADIADNFKTITANSNEFSLNVSGKNYQLLDLPLYFQAYLHKYFPSYFAAPSRTPSNQDFTISLQTKQFENYAHLIDTAITGLDYANFTGSINDINKTFQLQATIPSISYKNYHFSDIVLQGKGDTDSLNLTADITNTRVGENLNFPNTHMEIHSANDHSLVNINTKAENNINEINLNSDLYTLDDGIRIQMRPSNFILNEKLWTVDKRGELIVRKNFISADNIKLSQGFQEIVVSTDLDNDGGNTNTLTAKLRNVFLGDITSLFMKEEKINGIASGEVQLNDFLGDFSAESNLKIDQFSFGKDSIGVVNLLAAYDDKTGVVSYRVKSPNENYQFNADGFYHAKDTLGRPLSVNIDLQDSKIDLVETFLGDIFSDISGKATGKLLISGNPNKPDLFGNVYLKNTGLKVNYTNVYYTIDSAYIKFVPDGIDFGSFTITDPLKNKGVVRGKLFEKGFENMAFDFDIATNKMLLLNTKAIDNERFYGYAIGKASLNFSGPETKAKMTIVAEATDSSHIYIPNSVDKESGDADFIVFKNYGTEINTNKPKSNFDLTVDLDITANNKVAIDVILDELTGDAISANGNGRLRIIAGTSSDVSIKGRYNINKGDYNFNFQSFIKKPFKLLPQSGNYIEWNGDPFKADMKIDAFYEADNVSVSELISGQASSVSSATRSYRGPVYVIAELRDKLTKPTITFQLDFPQGSPMKSDPVFAQFLNTIQNNQNEMLSQASSLIVFGTFAPYGQGVLSGNSRNTALTNYGVSTITQVLTNEVNKAVSNLLYKLTKDKSLKFDIGANVYSSSSIVGQTGGAVVTNNNVLDRSRFNFKIGKSFFDDKIIVTFGGDLDFNVGAASTLAGGNLQWLPDLNVEFILSNDRRLRAIAFSKNSLDVNGNNLGRRNRQGISLTYKKDFEKNPFEKNTPTAGSLIPIDLKDEKEITIHKDSIPVNTSGK